MQLNDILEENSVRGISQKTKISEDNLENLLANKFDKLKKVKTLGFISIIEREYRADLSTLREEATSYYAQSIENQSVTLGLPIMEEKKGKSKFFMLVIFALLGYASWYFLTQFDKKHLSEMIPFIDESTIENFMDGIDMADDEVKELSLGSVESLVVKEEVKDTNTIVPTVANKQQTPSVNTVEITESVEDISPETSIPQYVSIIPESRLWFGVIDMGTKQRDHFSISDTFELNVSNKSWLVATSLASFSLKGTNGNKDFNDAQEHYFKIDKNAIDELSKETYISLGGWPQW